MKLFGQPHYPLREEISELAKTQVKNQKDDDASSIGSSGNEVSNSGLAASTTNTPKIIAPPTPPTTIKPSSAILATGQTKGAQDLCCPYPTCTAM